VCQHRCPTKRLWLEAWRAERVGTQAQANVTEALDQWGVNAVRLRLSEAAHWISFALFGARRSKILHKSCAARVVGGSRRKKSALHKILSPGSATDPDRDDPPWADRTVTVSARA
jgi:hypothetical protein